MTDVRALVCQLLLIALAAVGLTAVSNRAAIAAADGDSRGYVLTDEPEGAQDVIAVRHNAKDGADIVVVGRIGGNKNPWIANRAAFLLADNSLRACSDMPGDRCPTPWDYCCQTNLLPTSTTLVKVVDAHGKLVKIDARKLLGAKELQTVVVHGKAVRDSAGNLTVLADGVFVKR